MKTLTEIHTDIDARVQSISDDNVDWLCRMGCDGCCRRLAEIPRLTAKEWALSWDGLAALPSEQLLKIGRGIAAPLFWLGGKTFAVHDIQKVEARIKNVYAKQGLIHIYQVLVVHHNGKKAVLLSGLEMTEGQMIFIIDALNDYLKTLRCVP